MSIIKTYMQFETVLRSYKLTPNDLPAPTRTLINFLKRNVLKFKDRTEIPEEKMKQFEQYDTSVIEHIAKHVEGMSPEEWQTYKDTDKKPADFLAEKEAEELTKAIKRLIKNRLPLKSVPQLSIEIFLYASKISRSTNSRTVLFWITSYTLPTLG